MATPTHSAVILPVPEADAVIGEWRRRLDSSAEWGVPAHVTLLYPFVPPDAIDGQVIATVANALVGVGPVAFELTELLRFADGTCYLRPSPDAPLRTASHRLVAAFPDHPPYGGAVADPDPHVTVAEADRSAESADAERAIATRLPIVCRVAEAWIMAGAPEPGGWSVVARVRLEGSG